MLKRISTTLYRIVWYTFAVSVLSAAIIVTVLRFLLPGIGDHKEDFQSWLSEYMNYPLTIDSISAAWDGWSPSLYLEKIDLYSRNDAQLIGKLDAVHIDIDLIASLAQRELVPDYLMASGLELKFIRRPDGSISISSDDTGLINTDSAGRNKLSEWLLKQKHIVLEKTKLSWHDKNTASEAVSFSNLMLEFKTDNDRTQLDAYLSLPDQYGKVLKINMDIVGNLLGPNWDADIYAEVAQPNISALLSRFPVYTHGGNGKLKLWTHWKQAQLNSVSAEIDYSDFSLNSEAQSLAIDSLAIELHAERQQQQDWFATLKLRELETENGEWPGNEYQISLSKNKSTDHYHYLANLPYLKIAETLPFITSSLDIPKDTLNKLDIHSVKGELSDLIISFDKNQSGSDIFKSSARFHDLGASSSDGKYAFEHLDGQMQIDDQRINIQLDSEQSQLTIGTLYEKPITVKHIASEMDLVHGQTPELLIKKMSINLDDTPVEASGRVRLEETAPFADFIVRIGATNIETIPAYLPMQTDPELREWLNNAFSGGRLKSAGIIYRGYTRDFPFKNAEGIFTAILDIANTTLEYNEDWPPLDNIDIALRFDNENVMAVSNSGSIFDAQINKVTARIDNLDEDDNDVLVRASLTGHTSDVRQFIEQSPLIENEGLADLKEDITGHIKLNLSLDIPLYERKTQVDGLISFSDTTFITEISDLGLEGIHGDVNFNRYGAWANHLDALYHGNPVKIFMPELPDDAAGTEKIIINGLMDKDFIVSELNRFFPDLVDTIRMINDHVEGESKWEVVVNRINNRKKLIEISSDLDGVKIDLPYPITKAKAAIQPIKIKTEATTSPIKRVDIDYNDKLYTDIILDSTDDLTLEKMLVRLGVDKAADHGWMAGPPLLTAALGADKAAHHITDKISFQGELDYLDLSDWIDFINLNTNPDTVKKGQPKARSVSLEIFVSQLKIFGNHFQDVSIQLDDSQGKWQMFLDSNEIKGRSEFIDNIEPVADQLNIDLEYLVINHSDGEPGESTVAVHELPELNVNIDKATYNNIELGKTTLITKNMADKIHIENLRFSNPVFNIDANGQWIHSDNIDQSRFTASLTSASINRMLNTFGYNGNNIDGGETNMSFDINWMDTPLNASLENINGKINIDIGKGQLLDVDPSTGKLFGLLSLQTLPRRLSLDFTDLFKKGLAFDSITGDFSLQQGHAYTKALQMIGPAADIVISGRTGLITEDYEQIATVTPKLSNSLPLTSALLGGPVGIGVGAVIYLTSELFNSVPENINRILSYQYSIKGYWDKPDIKKIKKESG